jgi:hypothetical protein
MIRTTRLDRLGAAFALIVVALFVGPRVIRWIMHPREVEGRWRGAIGKARLDLLARPTADDQLVGFAVMYDSANAEPNQLLRVEGTHAGRDITLSLVAEDAPTYLLIVRFTNGGQLTGRMYGKSASSSVTLTQVH